MTMTHFPGERIVIKSSKSFAQVTHEFESIMGNGELELFEELSRSEPTVEQVIERVNSMLGKSGFMIFAKVDQGLFMSLIKQPQNARLYIFGNPLIAKQMWDKDWGTGLYIPLRLYVYDDPEGNTYITYDKPSSFLNQFENPAISAVAEILDKKLKEFTENLAKSETLASL